MKTKMMFLPLLFSVSMVIAEVKITYGVSTHQNKRPYQEDGFAHEEFTRAGHFFGVYDGHGGAHVSEALAELMHSMYFINGANSIKERFEFAFKRADDDIQQIYFNEGSTALTILIDKNNIMHCAWVGDTRAVLECGGKVCFFTSDHKPDRKDEKERIELAGGKIRLQGVWRVNGLAVSRSIGDASCKIQGVGQIIATPEYGMQQLKPDNHFLIMASDGLWDVIDNEDAVALVQQELQNKKSLNSIAQLLQNEAIKRGSRDNITVCVIKFDWQQSSILQRLWNWLRGK